MTNNERILNYIWNNLGKDLNDYYNELGCMQTVNNILKNCLGYEAGGGASTALGLKELEKNPNFKEVTTSQAQAGDLIISATGTGNGNIAHGHTGFLGENGVIYSNNSITGLLSGHLTAKMWREYFYIKGGFPTRYFRAIGEPKLAPVIVETPKPIEVTKDKETTGWDKIIPNVLNSTTNMLSIFVLVGSFVLVYSGKEIPEFWVMLTTSILGYKTYRTVTK